jgi:cob(I)alamin adenosyltransferase
MSLKIYTKTGDLGGTGLFGGKRVPKDNIRVTAYGTIDELNSHIGLVRDCVSDADAKELLREIQEDLFIIGSQIATETGKTVLIANIEEEDIISLEEAIDDMEKGLTPLKNFILPGGHIFVSFCHIARCVCRRAEREVISLSHEEEVDAIIIKYLNRLSDLLFVLSRKISKDTNATEQPWIPRNM